MMNGMNGGSETISDREALRLFSGRGDPEAFALLADRYGAMVLATCRRVLGDEGDAQDAAQDTFLKLSQGAGKIRTGLGAWLHACAMGTAIDRLRKDASRKRAEAGAAAISGSEPAKLWSEIEPLVDRALADLDEADRELIVGRYLAQLPLAQLARESGVSEGTASRRVARAMERLRGRLSAMGVVAPAAALTAAVTMGTAASGGLVVDSLAKIGLVGAAGGGKAGLSVGGVALIFGGVAALIGAAALIGPGLVGIGGGSSGGALAAAVMAAEDDLGPAAPRRELGPFEVVSAANESFEPRGIWIGEKTVSIRHGYTDEGEPKRATLRVVRVDRVSDDPETALDERAEILVRVASISPIDDQFSRFGVGQELTITCGFDALGRLVLDEKNREVQLGANEPRWFGVRPPQGWPEFGRIPDNPGPDGLLGPWTEAERVPVTISAEQITFGTENWTAARYAVVEWERVPGWSRVLAIYANGRKPTRIGRRFAMLIREVEGGYELAFFPPGSDRAGDWPSSFEVTEANPVRLVRIAGGE